MRIPIASAAFCEDCQSFGDSLIECECGSKALLTMSAVMNREAVLYVYFLKNRDTGKRIALGFDPSLDNEELRQLGVDMTDAAWTFEAERYRLAVNL